MELHPVNIGGLKTENNVFLAPLAGYTNYPFRKICLNSGAGLAFSEMVSAKGLHYGNENTQKLLLTGKEERIKAVQLFGSDPEILKEACESGALAPFELVDINMGCPMPKIYNNGEGSALLGNPALAAALVAACKSAGKRVSVKMRTGISAEIRAGADFAKALEAAGADLITVHGRTRDKIYAGECDFAAVAEIKKAVKIPVIVNGGIFGVADAEKAMNETGADGVMIARAAMHDPQIFCDFTGKERMSLREMILSQLDDVMRYYDEHFSLVYMRKMCVFYLKGGRSVAKRRNELFSCDSCAALREKVSEIFV